VIIEHAGVKGMHWGVRKRDAPRGSSSELAKADHSARNKKIAISAGIGVAVAASLFAGHRYLYTGGGSNARAVGKLATESSLRRVGSTPAKAIKTPSAATLRRSAEHQAFMKQFAAKQDLINKAANLDLKRGYERGMVPIPKREFLPSWT